MKIIYKILILFFLGFTFSSCATTIKVSVEHPPIADMRGVKKVAVIPFEDFTKTGYDPMIISNILGFLFWGDRSSVSHHEGVGTKLIRKAIVEEMSSAIINTGVYALIDSESLVGVDTQDYYKFVDVFIVGELSNIESTVNTHETTTNEKQSDGSYKKVTTRYDSRDVRLDFNYRFIRAKNREILYTVKKSGYKSAREDSARRLISAEDMGVSIVKEQLSKMYRELVPWTDIEKRKLMDDTMKKKDPSMKDALKLIDAKNYAAALQIYNTVYKKTSNYAAGYNAALLTEILGDLNEALKMMGELLARVTRDSKSSKFAEKTRVAIAKEFSRMQKYYIDARTLMDYRKR
ncbi:MAG: hypothetical protein LBV16_07860 [Elusimicrobiota bacterium]|jgi:hypothetical protein|nr:hypothetical protein [Elusimicrobiota bacterium]